MFVGYQFVWCKLQYSIFVQVSSNSMTLPETHNHLRFPFSLSSPNRENYCTLHGNEAYSLYCEACSVVSCFSISLLWGMDLLTYLFCGTFFLIHFYCMLCILFIAFLWYFTKSYNARPIAVILSISKTFSMVLFPLSSKFNKCSAEC